MNILRRHLYISHCRLSEKDKRADNIMTCLPYYTGVSYPLNIAFCIINITCSLTSVIGNSLTISAITKKQHLQMPHYLLLAALSATDLLAGCIPQPIYGIYLSYFHHSSICELEKAIVFMSATSCSASMLLLCGIARERHLQVSLGLNYNGYTSKSKVRSS